MEDKSLLFRLKRNRPQKKMDPSCIVTPQIGCCSVPHIPSKSETIQR